jgi:hypothetical protein
VQHHGEIITSERPENDPLLACPQGVDRRSFAGHGVLLRRAFRNRFGDSARFWHGSTALAGIVVDEAATVQARCRGTDIELGGDLDIERVASLD